MQARSNRRQGSVTITGEGDTMAILTDLLTQLQAERKRVQSELRRMDSAIRALRGVAGKNHAARSGVRRTLSLAARRRIAAAQRARWAKVRQMKKAA